MSCRKIGSDTSDDSPTPITGMSGARTSFTLSPATRCFRVIAVKSPAVPPPTIRMLVIGFLMVGSFDKAMPFSACTFWRRLVVGIFVTRFAFTPKKQLSEWVKHLGNSFGFDNSSLYNRADRFSPAEHGTCCRWF